MVWSLSLTAAPGASPAGDEQEAIGKPIEEILHPAVGNGRFLELLASSERMPLMNVVNRHGEEITLALTSAALLSPASLPSKTALVFRDVTEEDAAQRLRSYFLANISHEFRTPLSALKASVELLLEEIEDLSKAETVELVKSLHFSVTGLQTLIDNLLESVSIEAGRFHIRRRSTDLVTLVADAQKLMQPLLERRNQELVTDFPADLPRAEVDPMRLTQVLVNLISNASKYGPLDKPIGLDVRLEDANTLKVLGQRPGHRDFRWRTGKPFSGGLSAWMRKIRPSSALGWDCRWSRPSWKVMAGGWAWMHARAVGTSSGSRCLCGMYHEGAGGG